MTTRHAAGDPGEAAGEGGRRDAVGDAVRPDRLGDAGHLAVQQRAESAFGVPVGGGQPGAAGGEDQRGRPPRRRTAIAPTHRLAVRYDGRVLDREAQLAQGLDDQRAGLVGVRRPPRGWTRPRPQPGRLTERVQSPDFPPDFASTRTSVMTAPLSTALTMSTTVSAATETAVSASISTPVRSEVRTVAVMSTDVSVTVQVDGDAGDRERVAQRHQRRGPLGAP